MFAHIWKAMLPKILLKIMAASTLHLRAIFQWGSHNSLLVQDIYIYIYICILHFKGSFKLKNNNIKTTRKKKDTEGHRDTIVFPWSHLPQSSYLCITLTLTNRKYIHSSHFGTCFFYTQNYKKSSKKHHWIGLCDIITGSLPKICHFIHLKRTGAHYIR